MDSDCNMAGLDIGGSEDAGDRRGEVTRITARKIVQVPRKHHLLYPRPLNKSPPVHPLRLRPVVSPEFPILTVPARPGATAKPPELSGSLHRSRRSGGYLSHAPPSGGRSQDGRSDLGPLPPRYASRSDRILARPAPPSAPVSHVYSLASQS
jgi:hypothetical protein